MKDPLTILFVEDRQEHAVDLQRMLGRELPRLPIRVEDKHATNLDDALIFLKVCDVVVTDLFYPDQQGGDATQSNGQRLAEQCLKAGKPVVIVTSTFHHGEATEPTNQWCKQSGVGLVDCPNAPKESPYNHQQRKLAGDHTDLEGEIKSWKEGLYALLYVVVALNAGLAEFRDGKLLGISNSKFVNGQPLCAGAHTVESLIKGTTLTPHDEEYSPALQPMIEQGFPHG